MQQIETTLKQRVTSKVLDKMMELAGYSLYYSDYLKLQDNQKNRYKITQQALDTWSRWAVQVIENELKCTTYEAELEVSWIQHNFALLEK
jgi:hypothetical protein